MVKFVYTCLLLCWVVSVGLLGCGGDEVEEERDPLEDLVGSWELIKIGSKTPEAYFQGDGNDGAVSEASMKLVFASDGSLYREASISFSETESIDTEILGLKVEYTIELKLKITVNGSYVASGSTLEIISGDRVNSDVSFSVSYDVDTAGIPELEELELELNEKARELEKEFNEEFKEAERSLEQEFREEFGLELTTYTWHLENDLLTLTNEDQEVYRKK